MKMNENQEIRFPIRFLALLLALVLVFEILPAQALAADGDVSAAETLGVETDAAEDTASDSEALTVTGEVEALRTETTKHFRLSDGSYIAVDYNMAVHYAQGEGENQTWEDIDNTLQADVDAYTAGNGLGEKSFASAFSPDTPLVSASWGDYGVEMSLLREETALALAGTAQASAFSANASSESSAQMAEYVEAVLLDDAPVSTMSLEDTEIPGELVDQVALDML